MRGTLCSLRNSREAVGIIPAYAGNTGMPSDSVLQPGDHPRVCGEHPVEHDARGVGLGSSPRMRGTLHGIPVRRAQPGIIPAYAGNTGSAHAFERRSWDHPRVCGEHLYLAFKLSGLRGSSPRMRGTHIQKSGLVAGDGIIPAYAGNTRPPMLVEDVARDHPRVCGEHI